MLVLAVIGALTILAVLLRVSSIKGFYVGLEFHEKPLCKPPLKHGH